MNDPERDQQKEEIRRRHPLETYLPHRGVELRRSGVELAGVCPFHEDKKPSLNVNVGKQLWTCRVCGAGGDVFAFVQQRDGLTFAAALEKLNGGPVILSNQSNSKSNNGSVHRAPAVSPSNKVHEESTHKVITAPRKIVATYPYTDAAGVELFQALRFEPKDFRQRRRLPDGSWAWNLEGVAPVLYRLPEILAASTVWVVEGEKDADALREFGLAATCNPMGAGKWKDDYSPFLAGKEVILCGDNDEVGQRHMDAVERALAAHAKFTKRVRVPDPYKDVSDLLAGSATPEAGALVLMELAQVAPELYRGVELPLQSMADLEREYAMSVTREDTAAVDLSRLFPGLKHYVRPLVPGELAAVLAGTGAGKTMFLQNLALKLVPLPTILFELELPGTLTFERFVGLQSRQSGRRVNEAYHGERSQWPAWRQSGGLNHIFTCSRSNLTVEDMTRFVNLAHLKMGVRPVVVMVDYFGLVSARGGSRYERMSAVAEELKVMAKATNTVVIATSQISRPEKDDADPEVFLHSAKDSGSVENSSGLVLGLWRPNGPGSPELTLKVLKNTKGLAGRKIDCLSDESLCIREITAAIP